MSTSPDFPRYRHRLPQLQPDGLPFLTDGGLETTLIYREGVDLPLFAAYPLLADEAGRALLRRYFEGYVRIAAAQGLGAVLETPTWRANADWGARLGHDAAALDRFNRQAVELLLAVREAAQVAVPVVVSGNLGPRGDGYVADGRMDADAARRYHAVQVASFAATAVDLVSVFTMNYVDEAIGVVRAAADHGLPVVVSFTVETDGRLPSGQPLGEAIEACDAATAGAAAGYLLNCAHPSHFAALLDGAPAAAWQQRLRGVRVNASPRSHAELDAATELDAGDPLALARDCAALHGRAPRLRVFGGCCGTDERHVAAIGHALWPAAQPVAA